MELVNGDIILKKHHNLIVFFIQAARKKLVNFFFQIWFFNLIDCFHDILSTGLEY